MNNTDNKLTPPSISGIQLDACLTAALEHKPAPQIPADFAAKVAARAATQPQRRRTYKPHFGSMIALFSVPVIAVALFVLASHTTPTLHSLSFDAELALLCELAFIGWWMSRTVFSRASR